MRLLVKFYIIFFSVNRKTISEIEPFLLLLNVQYGFVPGQISQFHSILLLFMGRSQRLKAEKQASVLVIITRVPKYCIQNNHRHFEQLL